MNDTTPPLPLPSRRPRQRPLFVMALLATAVAAVIGLSLGAYGSRAPPAPAPKPLKTVTATTAQASDIPIKLATQGHLITLNQVDVRPQADGIVRGVHFREGDEVRPGQLLFSIDSSNAEAALARANAQAAQYKAQVDDAQRDLTRTQALAKSHFYSSSAVDTSASKLESLQAQWHAAQADVQGARVALDRTRIVAPGAGLTGALNVHPGSLAQQGASLPMVTLVQFDPIGVDFTLPEGHLAGLLQARAAGQVRISLQLQGAGTAGTSQDGGTLVFVNNTVNTDTGTINLKAAFPNAAKRLWPGAYVKVLVDAGVSRGAITLPPQAVLDGPQGRFVYRLDAQDKVSAQPVKLVRIQDQRAIVEGLQAGERVVVEGTLAVKPGDVVKVASAASGVQP